MRGLLLATTLLLAVGCGGDDVPALGDRRTELVVFAAASLTDALEEIGQAFTAAQPDVEVVFNFAGSQVLAEQINQGAPADVFAAANVEQMNVVVEAGNVAGEAVVFASNMLAIAVETGNPFGVEDVADLADPQLVVVLPAEGVPAGDHARAVLSAADVEVSPASLEQDVRAALSKVVLGEADAAIVFASDIVAFGDRVDGVAIPAAVNVSATYPIAVLAGARNTEAARTFIEFVRGADGQRILMRHGFASP